MEAVSCLAIYWKGFLLGGVISFLVSCGLLAIGACLGGAKLNERQEQILDRLGRSR